jgi:hypothetical protein
MSGHELMRSAVAGLAGQLRWGSGLSVPAVPSARSVLVCGMGGSGIAGDFAREVASAHGRRLDVHKGYGLPGWAGSEEGLLVVALSYSGNTEETLAAVEAALSAGVPIAGVSSGGTLAELATRRGFPLVTVPGGLQPRAALGFLLSALLQVLAGAGVLPDPRADLDEAMNYDIATPTLSEQGSQRLVWAGRRMQVLSTIRERFRAERPLEGKTIAACLHVTAETANLMLALRDAGARPILCASNPLSTQDDVAAALVAEGISVFAIRGEDNTSYYQHLNAALDMEPDITMDDGADLATLLHTSRTDITPLGSTEETTTGVIRLRAMFEEGKLRLPVVAVNDSQTKHLFDNKYGTGQSAIDGIIRATNVLIAGLTVVVVGYGNCGQGVASRADGLGAKVVVVEVDPVRALAAAMDGYRVLTADDAARIGDIFLTVTGNKHVLRRRTSRS